MRTPNESVQGSFFDARVVLRVSFTGIGNSFHSRRARLFLGGSAVDDGVLLANPATRLGKALHLHRSRAARQEQVKAFDAGQLARFLAVVAERNPRYRSLFFMMSRTGLRIGEALALQWGDLDFEAREIRVERAISNTGVIDTPKSGHGRTVDMAVTVGDVLRTCRARLAEHWLKRKPDRDKQGTEIPKGEMPPWVFPWRSGSPRTTRT